MVNINFIILVLLFSYVLYRIGRKITEEKLYHWYLVPIQVVWTLIKNSDIKVVAVFVLGFIINMFLPDIDSDMKNNIIDALLFIFILNFFGTLARSLDKSYWFYGLLSLSLWFHLGLVYPLLAMLAFSFKNLYSRSIEGKIEFNKNEIKKYLWFIALIVIVSYGVDLYKEVEKNRINENYERLCDKNIADYDTLYETVYEWINEIGIPSKALSYLMLLMFEDDRMQHKLTIDFYYIALADDNPPDSKTKLYNNFKDSFNKAFSKVMELKEEERKTFKKENICFVYQIYIIDMATSKVLIDDEVEKFCEGLIDSKTVIKK